MTATLALQDTNVVCFLLYLQRTSGSKWGRVVMNTQSTTIIGLEVPFVARESRPLGYD